MSKQKVMIPTMVEPEIKERIDLERGHETRSSFVRRVLVRWYNQQKGADAIEE